MSIHSVHWYNQCTVAQQSVLYYDVAVHAAESFPRFICTDERLGVYVVATFRFVYVCSFALRAVKRMWKDC